MSHPPKVTATTHVTATPAMRQYLDTKHQHRDAIVFFRMGDFYEMFYEDAITAARVLELTLTSRSKDSSGNPIPMCGVPHHAADTYVARLVKQGFRVALCEQVENPKKAKGLVRREVVRIVSPGTLTDASHLEAREPAFLLAIALATTQQPTRATPGTSGSLGRNVTTYGAAVVDFSTGEFSTAEYTGPQGLAALADELPALEPREILLSADIDLQRELPEVAATNIPVTTLDDWMFGLERAESVLTDQLRAVSLDGFGLTDHPVAIRAAGALVQYLRDSQKADLAHLRRVTFRSRAEHMVIDASTFKHLEVLEGSEGGRSGSLLGEIDRTITPMGGRLLRAWLLRPQAASTQIQDRLDAVEELAFQSTTRTKLQATLKTVSDLERLLARAALGTAGPRDLMALGLSVTAIPRVRLLLSDFHAPLIRSLVNELDDVADVRDTIVSTFVDEPPSLAREGGYIRDGVDREVDELRTIIRDAKQAIASMEAAERTRTGIGSLKVRYNRVFGYYIEVSKANLHAVPDDYHRRQTITSGERFVTPALKEYERKVLGADERALEREQELFETVSQRVVSAADKIQNSARSLAAIDVLASLAETAVLNNYTKPHINDGDEISITDGRHPVVERNHQNAFVPNDVLMNGTTHQLVILTGPNMGGKSTYLRQTALIVLMAQTGSFVPAAKATISVVDRIFARVGASDNIARGQSTFLLEMQETAKILHTATSRSLVLLDEIGRGTSTFDGLSIAWAVAEHLATNQRAQPKTLFATHYHELTDLADTLAGVVNYHVAAREWNDDIVFFRKVEPGRSDRSYGIQVARLAGLPSETVTRAKTILAGLERDELSRGGRPSFSGQPSKQKAQLGLFQVLPANQNRIAERLREVDVERLTPLDALSLLTELKHDLND